MSPQEWLQRGKSAFEIYLRTGVMLGDPAAPLALKYNPWHDIEDGRFTRAGMGRKVPPKFGGYGGGGRGFDGGGATGVFGGGDFGGGGASGSWDAPGHKNPKTKPKLRKPITPAVVSPDSSAHRPRPPSPVVQTIHANGYAFAMDAQHRTRQITGSLTDGPRSTRSRSMQSNAGKPDRLPTDDGGHYIATRFNGPREKFNHFAQDANVNRGRYRALEAEWARQLAQGKKMKVDIRPQYEGSSVRPHRIDVIWYIDGVRHSIKLSNKKGI
jgi:hypothetical protein